jgi:hypothetical protein
VVHHVRLGSIGSHADDLRVGTVEGEKGKGCFMNLASVLNSASGEDDADAWFHLEPPAPRRGFGVWFLPALSGTAESVDDPGPFYLSAFAEGVPQATLPKSFAREDL